MKKEYVVYIQVALHVSTFFQRRQERFGIDRGDLPHSSACLPERPSLETVAAALPCRTEVFPSAAPPNMIQTWKLLCHGCSSKRPTSGSPNGSSPGSKFCHFFLSLKGCVYIPQLFWCSKQNLKLENTLDSLRWTQQKCLNSSCLDLPASPLEARTIVETFCVICFSLGRIVTVRLVPAPSRVFVAKPFHREHIQRKLR